jgi:hypothetical protein
MYVSGMQIKPILSNWKECKGRLNNIFIPEGQTIITQFTDFLLPQLPQPYLLNIYYLHQQKIVVRETSIFRLLCAGCHDKEGRGCLQLLLRL